MVSTGCTGFRSPIMGGFSQHAEAAWCVGRGGRVLQDHAHDQELPRSQHQNLDLGCKLGPTLWAKEISEQRSSMMSAVRRLR